MILRLLGLAWVGGSFVLIGLVLAIEVRDQWRERRLCRRLERLLALPPARDPEIRA